LSSYDAIAELYDPWSVSVVEDVAFYLEEARRSGGPVVELGVGTGRIAVPIAADGIRVIGVDSSRGMLDVCARRAALAGVEIDLRVGDLREPPVDELVPLVICPFRSLLHMHTDEDRLAVFAAAHRLLLRDGRFVFDVFAPDAADIALTQDRWLEREPGIFERAVWDEAARTLTRQGVDVIVTSGGDHSTRAAQQATATIPIVFLEAADPVGAGFVKSLARPGGNITGLADLGLELVPKGLEIFRELIPRLRRVLLVYDATNDFTVSQLPVYRDAAQRLGLMLVERPVRTEDEARSVISAIKKSEIDGIFSPRVLSQNIPGLILEIAPKRGIPTMFETPFYVERAGLASYGADKYALGRQAARLVDKILKGAKPGDIPVEQPTKFELAINVKAAKALGIVIPQSMLLRADRLIQ